MEQRADLDLVESRVPFVRATVVRAQEPTSARVGDTAIVHADGTIDGFVGGQCAAGTVRSNAMGVLDSGDGVLLRILPDGAEEFPDTSGAVVAVNPCLSGGSLEIFLEPVLPPPIVQVVGESPIARAVAELAVPLGFEITETGPMPGTVAVVVSTHGGEEATVMRAALEAGVGHVALVASTRRGAALLDEMGLSDEERSRVHTPAGLDIGAQTPPEVALSIWAEIVRAVRVDKLTAIAEAPISSDGTVPADGPVLQVTDPVCGMTVTVGPDTPHAEVDGLDHWFCCPGCRDRYVAEHA